MAKSNEPDPRQLRQAVLELSRLQDELRRRLVDHRRGSSETLNALAIRVGTAGHRLKTFLDGTSVLSGSRGLTGLCDMLECPELGQRIAELAEIIGHRNLGYATRSSEVIEMVFDLFEYYYENDRHEKYTMAEFAAIFGDDAEVVLGVLNRNPDQVAVLDDERTRVRLTQVLIDNRLDQQLEAAKGQFTARRMEAAARLKRLVDELTPRAGGVTKLAQLLNTPRNSLYYAVTGQAGLKGINELIGKAEKLAEMTGSSAPARVSQPTDDDAAAGDVTDQGLGSGGGIPAELEALGGATTAEGIRYVLTADSFRKIDTVALVDLREMLMRHVPIVRLLLNWGSQLSDEIAREILREDPKLARELRELVNAIRFFTFEDPSVLLELYDDDRAHRGKTGDKRKDKRARS